MLHSALLAFADFIDSGRWLKLLLMCGGAMMLYTAWKVQRGHNGVDFKEMLVDENGKASPTRIIQLGAFASSTWVFIVLADAGHLTEWYFTGYMTVWSGTRLLTKYLDRPVPPKPPALVVNVPAQPEAPT